MHTKQLALRTSRRKSRVRTVLQEATLPRLNIHRTNQHIYAQIIEQGTGKILAVASDLGVTKKITGTKTERASTVGTKIAELAKSAKVKAVVFDRGSFKYHGRVKALADGARQGGLEF